MNGQISLLNKKISEAATDKKKPTYKIYLEDNTGTIYSTKLQAQVETVNDAIAQAIKNFNQNLSANLPQDLSLYELYAVKNGKRDTGLPSFEKTQPLSKVGKEKFILVCKSKQIRLLSNQSQPSASKNIESDFEERVKKSESEKQKGLFCFCGGW